MNNREIGGYIELDSWRKPSLHRNSIPLNSGRNCLLYIAKARNIKSLLLPDFMCDSVSMLCDAHGINYRLYHIDELFKPIYDFEVQADEYLYLMDYYGQLTDEDIEFARRYCNERLIVDEAQSLFRQPLNSTDTLYSVRKFLGVPDGAFLYTSCNLNEDIPLDKSYQHVDFLLGRLEENASEFYRQYQENNERFINEPIKRMSRLTSALIGALDLNRIKLRREKNFEYLAYKLGKHNALSLRSVPGPFAYPLLVENGPEARKQLASQRIYVPTLWPNVIDNAESGAIACKYASNILPLPIDQRYGYREMNTIVEALESLELIPREFTGKKLAILGGTLITCEIVKAAQRLGVETYVIDYNSVEESPAKRIADHHALISVADIDEVVAYISDNEIDGVLCGYSDSILGFYAQICEKAGLPCYGNEELFDIYTNKDKWKDACTTFGVPTAKKYGPEILDLPASKLPLPLFVKPVIGSGARGTGIARTQEEFELLYDKAKQASGNGEVLVEDYLEGPEVTVFWLMIDGKYYVNQIGNRLVKNNQKGAIPLPTGYSFPSSVIPIYLEKIAPNVKAMFEAQGLQNGMMFMQCIVRDGIPFVYDIGYRTTGSLEHLIQSEIAGYSSMDMLIRFALTGSMTTDEHIEERINEGLYAPCFNVSCLMKPGTIDHFEGIDKIEDDSNVIAAVKAHVEGETLPAEAKGELRQIALRILGMAQSSYELSSIMLNVQRAISILSPTGEELMLPGFDAEDTSRDLLASETDWQV